MANVKFYFDEMLNQAAAKQFIQRGYEVIMAKDIDMVEKDDFEHLAYATAHQMIMVTFDHPFAHKASARSDHGGVVCLSGKFQADIGSIVRLLSEFAELYDPEKDVGQVFWL